MGRLTKKAGGDKFGGLKGLVRLRESEAFSYLGLKMNRDSGLGTLAPAEFSILVSTGFS